MDNKFVPETLTQCREHYVPPVEEYIQCIGFGNSDGTNGACWWCMEMTPYQWHMCQDETWVRGLLRSTARVQYKDRHEAIQFIEEYKKKHPMGNERAAIQSETAEPVQASRGLHLGSRYYCSNCNKLACMENYCSSCGAKVIKED